MKEEIKTKKTPAKAKKTSSTTKKQTTKSESTKTKTISKKETVAKTNTQKKPTSQLDTKNKETVKKANSSKTNNTIENSTKTNSTNEMLRMVIVGGVLLTLIALTFIIGITKNVSKTRYQKHIGINEISVSEYMKIIDEEDTSLIYIARPTCSYCQMFEPVLTSVLEKYKIGVEYIDISAIATQEEWDKFYNSNEFLSAGEWGTPTLLIYKDKKILDINSGYVEEEDLVKFLKDNKLIGE